MNLGFRKAFGVVSDGTLITNQGLDKTNRYKKKRVTAAKVQILMGRDTEGGSAMVSSRSVSVSVFVKSNEPDTGNIVWKTGLELKFLEMQTDKNEIQLISWGQM